MRLTLPPTHGTCGGSSLETQSLNIEALGVIYDISGRHGALQVHDSLLLVEVETKYCQRQSTLVTVGSALKGVC